MGEQKERKVSEKDALKDAEKQLDAINDAKNATKAEIKSEGNTKKAKKAVKKVKRTKKRSAKYAEITKDFDKTKYYNLEEALEYVKKTSYTKFDGTVEMLVKIARKKNQQPVRKMIELPHGTGKKVNVVILDEKMIEEIAKTKKIDFDVAIATPSIMPKIAKIAKILGPKGKMPNPKSGTVTTEPEKAKKELEGGKTEVRETCPGMIQQVIGKVSYDTIKLTDNFQKILSIVPKSQIKGVSLTATMGPSVKVKF